MKNTKSKEQNVCVTHAVMVNSTHLLLLISHPP